jgi:tellurite methyltransferase
VYSRFTFHSINDAQQEAFLSSIRKSGTYLCIESRSDKGLEEQRIHGDGHFRNFTSLIKLRRQLLAHAFDIVYQYEGRDAAIYKEENPMCVRVLAKKK